MSDAQVVLLVELFLITAVPLSWLLTGYSWLLAHRYWSGGFRLPFVLALVNSFVFYAGLILGYFSIRALLGLPRVENTGVFGLSSIAILSFVPMLTTGYLMWLDIRRRS